MDITYRSGRAEDCLKIAEGIERASGGIMEFLLHGLLKGETVAEFIAKFLRDENSGDSYNKAIIAECEGEVIGITYSYPAELHGMSKEAQAFFPSERLKVLQEFFNSRVDGSWFLDSIYVDERFRGRGIGNALIDCTKARAKDNGRQQLSLMVMHENHVARRAYERNAFRTVKHIPVEEHPLLQSGGGIYLLVSDIE